MLNLQTVTEDLGIMCQGRAWIVVTSQQDIDKLMKVPGNDFSKIQGRFKTRLALSSANVDEVIRRRILAKNSTATETLELLYEKKEAILKNSISFTPDTAEKKMYMNSADFAAVYPFIPYQFNLLGSVLTSIREHGASGKHLAEGERSMLALFQESAISIMEKELGVLMPFNIFYNALDKFIDHRHRSVIIKATNNQLLNEFDVEVLKVLFMIKYLDEIKANLENLTTLMISEIDQDRVVLKEKIKKSLQRLKGQFLIQKNGDIYSFLTNEEQDINREISHQNVELGEILNEASNVIFEDIFPDKKYNYTNRYNFPFNQIIDEIYRGNRQSSDIGVRIITPYYDFKEDKNSSQSQLSEQSKSQRISNILRGLSDSNNEVIIHLNDDLTFLEEIEEYLKINKYLTKRSAQLSKTSEAIHNAKKAESSEKFERIRIFLEEALKTADIYVKGDKVVIKEKNPVDRINDALNKLVDKIYHKLDYMKTYPVKSDILDVLRDTKQDQFGKTENVENDLAIEDMNHYIELETQIHTKPQLKRILNKFNKAPYGFVDLDIEWLVATLFAQKRISLIKNAQNISLKTNRPEDILKYLTERKYQEKILIDKKTDTSEDKIKIVKDVLRDFFDEMHSTNDDEALMELFQDKAKIKLDTIEKVEVQYQFEERYPGKEIIIEAKELLMDVAAIKSLVPFYEFVFTRQNEFLRLGEELDSVLSFFKGKQKDYFKMACEVTDLYNENKNYIDNQELSDIANQIAMIINMPRPFSDIQKLPLLIDNFDSLHKAILENESEPIRKDIESDLSQILNELDTNEVKEEFEEQFKNNFHEIETKLMESQKISEIRGKRDESYFLSKKCREKIKQFKQNIPPKNDDTETIENETFDEPVIVEKDLELRNISSKTNITIKKEDDIDNFLESLRKKLKEELDDNTVINLRI